MATYRKILKDKDGNNIIPALAGDETGWVNTADIADGAVDATKIDWSGTNGVIKTVSDQSGNRTAIYFGDGTMIVKRKVTGTSAIDTAVGSLYYTEIPASNDYWALAPASNPDFVAQPVVSYSVYSSGQYMWIGNNQYGVVNTSGTGNRWAIPNRSLRLFRATTHASANWEVHIIAIGRWKS